jgi:drug/metabolite transporter (DMT)-like permease
MEPNAPPASSAHGRLCILLAALFWSLGGACAKILTHDTFLHLNEPALANPSLQIACFRVLFAGLVLIPTLRRKDITFSPRMFGMVASFATMNVLYVSAMTLGTAANAIILQYTAPMWMYLACIWLLGESADRRSSTALLVGLLGIGFILWGGWMETPSTNPEASDASVGGRPLLVILLGLGSGFAFAGVLVFLRVLRDAPSNWLTVLNHVGGAAVLLPFIVGIPLPSVPQLAFLFVYGAVQMSLPYWLAARGLREVSPQEAGTILLLEPILNPVWAYLVVGEAPSRYTLGGGVFIVGALAWRYWPRREKEK